MAKKQSNLKKLLIRIPLLVGSPASLLIHTLIFMMSFSLMLLGLNPEMVLLILTTIVSLEAIYLSIIIQYSVNEQSKHIKQIREDVDDVLEDTEELTE